MTYLRFAMFSILLSSCGPTLVSDSSLKVENDDVIYSLGIQKGILIEKINQYEKAKTIIDAQITEIEENFEKMPAVKFKTLIEIEKTLREGLKILDVNPVNDTFSTLKKVKLGLGRTVKAIAVIESIETLEPLIAEYASAITVLKDIHENVFAVFTEISSVLPFISTYIRYIDRAFQDYARMQITAANSAIYEDIADYAVNGATLGLEDQEMGITENYKSYNRYWEYWSNVKQGRSTLKSIVGEAPPIISWACKLCTRNIENIVKGKEGLVPFRKYLQNNASKIYIAIDELRIQNGGEAFPIFMGPQSWRTEIGGSRKWRKPMVLQNLRQHRDQLMLLTNQANHTIKSLDLISSSIVKARKDDADIAK